MGVVRRSGVVGDIEATGRTLIEITASRGAGMAGGV